jgi:hypothetical protein
VKLHSSEFQLVKHTPSLRGFVVRDILPDLIQLRPWEDFTGEVSYTLNEWRRRETTLGTSGEDVKLHSERVHFQSSLWRAFVVLILVIFNSEVNPDVLNVACKLICDNVPQQFSLILVKQPQFNRYRSSVVPHSFRV